MENVIQHFKMQFGLEFSNIQPNDANQWDLGNSTLSPVLSPVNSTLVFNNWMRKRKSKCFPVGIGAFEVTFDSTVMLHRVYCGEEGNQSMRVTFGGMVTTSFSMLALSNQYWSNVKLLLEHAYCQLKDGVLRSFNSTTASLVGGVLKMLLRQDLAQITQ